MTVVFETPGKVHVVTRAKCSRGFTLIEIMIVIVIIGILGAFIVPRIMGRPDEARIVAAKQDIASISQALKLYRLDNLRYPTTEQGLQALVKKPTTAPVPPNWKSNGYLERLPNDPWKQPYQYLQPGLHGEVDVMSFGADGAPKVMMQISARGTCRAQWLDQSGMGCHATPLPQRYRGG
jgi:general secretion pathway protein G